MDRPATMTEAAREFAANSSDPNPERCRCHGGGWILSPFDSWEKCPRHFNGQKYPEDFDEEEDLTEGERAFLEFGTTSVPERRTCEPPYGDNLPR